MNASAPMIRTFRARDARAALGAVKEAFGSDAVIIETKHISGGLFGRAQIEVTAALGDRPQPRSVGRDHQMETDMAALRRVMDDVKLTLQRSQVTRAPNDAGEVGERELGAEARRVLRHLIDRGLDAAEARALLDDAICTGAERASELFPAVASVIGKRLTAAPAPWSADARRTIALVGPTGVGKTTAIAKIAARALLETQFKIGLITVDTYRVGASDQLARYGKIMGVPTYVARDRAALATAVERTRDADLVLIDTAGRSDAESLAAQMDLVKSVPNIQLQLVLSVATGARELGAVARRYKSFGADRLIFTKLDEAEAPASALAATAVLSRPISCLCDGQRVPEDIHPVTDTTLVERLLAPPLSFLAPLGSQHALASYGKEHLRGSSR
jgi:flagellar biosynthesis protein FlhF